MRFLYHEIRSTGSIEEARGHTDTMERQVANGCVAGKGRIINTKYKITMVFLCSSLSAHNFYTFETTDRLSQIPV